MKESPASCLVIDALKELHLGGNDEIQVPPKEIAEKDISLIRKYFHAIYEGE